MSLNYGYAQLGLNAGEGAKSLGMGGTGVAIEGIYGMFHNQAGIIEVENLSVVIDAQRRFSLADLSSYSGAIVKNTKLGHFGIMISNYGSEVYQDQKIGLAYARKLTDILSIGAQFNTLLLSIDDFGSATNFSFELGINAKLSNELNLSAHVNNPVSIEITENTQIDTRFRFGIKYVPSSKIELLSEIDKILDSPMNFRAGIQYSLFEKLELRCGYSTAIGTIGFGLHYSLSNSIALDFGYSTHAQLGSTPGISLIWNKFNK